MQSTCIFSRFQWGFAGCLNFYQMKVVLFLEDSEGDISRDMISAELNDVWKGWGSRVGSQTFITTEFHLWSLHSPWEWKVPLELCVVFFRSTELSHWNFLSCIWVFVKLNAMAKQEATSFLKSRLKQTGTQPWFCAFKIQKTLFITRISNLQMPWPINDFSIIIFIKVLLV